ncbi:MAG: tryptophan-rich sensory protein [Candidatus Woesebacteria bacterium]|jgi:tryptophan-rich sensory protein
MSLKRAKLLIFSIFISHLAGIIGSLATSSSVSTWYPKLNKPLFNPPNWVFAPVWLTLYTLMGTSLYLIWVKGFKKKKIELTVQVFFIHLFFNSLWSVVFFGFQNLALAFLIIIILWLMIAYLIRLFWQINKKAAYLLLPYILWVSFAALLNYSIWQLN